MHAFGSIKFLGQAERPARSSTCASLGNTANPASRVGGPIILAPTGLSFSQVLRE
jgi:hypothetical protein